jgi:hypothetical protein
MSAKCLLSLVVLFACGLATAAVPTVTAVNPSSGVDAGGQKVTITGTNFNTPAVVAVTFGGTSAVTFTVINNTTIIAETPFHVAGVVSVEVNNGAGSAPNALYEFKADNPAVQVTAKVTLKKQAVLQWGNGTTVDDAGIDHTVLAQRISAYVWIVKDALSGVDLDMNTAYLTNDTTNAKTIFISNISVSYSDLTVSATVRNTADWQAGAAPGADTYRVRAKIGAGAFVQLSNVAAALTNALIRGADQEVVLEFTTPTAIKALSAGLQQAFVVTFTATPN